VIARDSPLVISVLEFRILYGSIHVFHIPYKGTDLFTNNAVAVSGKITLQLWDAAIVEEK
jgi:hypothetical protein